MLHRPGMAPLAAMFFLLAAGSGTPQSALAQAQPALPAGGGTTSATPAAATPPAIPDDPYSVNGVEVDVTAANAAEARDKAILEGQKKAFAILYKRLSADGGPKAPPGVSDADLQRMVQAFEIDRERGSAVRYVGSLSFKFRPRVVRSYLSSLGITVVEPNRRPVAGAMPVGVMPTAVVPAASLKPTLVLPVTLMAAGAVLWEESTAWRGAWDDFAVAAGAARVVVPRGELADIADIGATEAINGDAASLARIAAHYDVGDVVVATLANADRLDPAVGGQVTVNRYSPDGRPEGPPDSVAVPGSPGEAPASLLNRAVSSVVERLASLPHGSSSPQPTTATGADGQALVATVPITSMGDWLEVRRRLASNPLVSNIETQSMTRSRVEVTIRFRGDQDGLRAMLDRDSLTLVTTPAGLTLYLKSSAQPPGQAAPSPAPLTAQPPVPPVVPQSYTPPPQAYPPQAYPQPSPPAYAPYNAQRVQPPAAAVGPAPGGLPDSVYDTADPVPQDDQDSGNGPGQPPPGVYPPAYPGYPAPPRR